jgi:hypothetical protein|uniref:VanZ-like domain-containing protein n=1 Tax=viral metagenome TaxID=1070528 RepID=A0A6C0BPD1_9ZZZZ
MGLLLFDQYTYLHFASGIIAFFWGISLSNWMILHMLFELAENTKAGLYFINHFTFWPGGKPYKDSIMNIIGDNIGTLLGWLSARAVEKIANKYNLY